MLESEVNNPKHSCKEDSRDHNQEGRTLEFVPSRPRCLLRELYKRLFKIVDELFHLYI